jgi:hypothetical protein
MTRFFRPHRRLALAVALWLWMPASHPEAQTTTFPADRFVDSAGVNIHLHYDGTPYYDNFELIKRRLLELGVRHVRDGLVDTEWQGYYDRHNSLGTAGIKGLYITSPRMATRVLREYPSRVSRSFEAYEAPNEYNQSGDARWVETLRASLGQLHGLRNDPALAAFPVYGPSLTLEAAYSELGDVSSLIDAGNLHNYFGGRNPGTTGWGANGYGSIEWNLQLVRRFSGGKPIVTTETGYSNDSSVTDFTPQDVAARYMPRLLLEQFRKGIVRTYLYELSDFSTPDRNMKSGFGLINRDGSPKPAFNAVKNLLTLLSDPGPAIEVRSLDYSLQGAGSDVRHMAFQKRDGSHFLALWIEQSSYDVSTRRAVVVPARAITVTIAGSVRIGKAYRWDARGNVSQTDLPAATTAIPVTVTDSLTLLEFRPGSPPSPTSMRVLPR